jgi:hypothetical protein
MTKRIAVVGVGLCICLSRLVVAATWYVDGSVSQPGDGSSWESAFKRIQEGIDASSNRDTVIVAEGTYVENISFKAKKTKNIILRSTNPLNPNVVASTIIDGNQSGSVVTFAGTEDGSCVLSGFTIRNGQAVYGGGICGGTWEPGLEPKITPTRATIENNVIEGNTALEYAFYGGGGLACCNGIIRNTVIRGNTASFGLGGGLLQCHGLIEGNTITGNSAERPGGGLCDCDGVIRGNTITANEALEGGGLAGCDGTILNNIIKNNRATAPPTMGGGGLVNCDGTIENNLIAGNSAAFAGGGVCSCYGILLNNTIVANSAQRGGGLDNCLAMIRNCIIWGNAAGGEGDQFYEAGPACYSCIQDSNRGGQGNISDDPLFVDESHRDYRLQPDSPCVDAGCDYYWFVWPQRDLDGNCRLAGDGIDMGCFEYGSSPDTDGGLLSDEDELAATTNTNHSDTDGDGLRDGLEILRGTNPLEITLPGTIRFPADARTIQQSLCLSRDGDEIIVSPGTYEENLVFCGANVTLRSTDPENPDLVASTIIDGQALGPVVSFMGTESEACVLSGFTIQNGDASDGGGILGSTAFGAWNRSTTQWTHATILNNTITGNRAKYGGGLNGCDGTIDGNTISGNSASESGGGLSECNGTIRSNTIIGNSAGYNGGGLANCHGIIQNDTIAGNSAVGRGGGLASCNGTIQNCIIWGNAAPTVPQLDDYSVPTYSCIQEWGAAGNWNIALNPQFVDPDGPDDDPQTYEDNDYRLLPISPCIDAGLNESWMWDAEDLDKNPRIFYGISSVTVDMGAYEYASWPFHVAQIIENGAGTELRWVSRPGDTYVVWSSDALPCVQWTEEATPPSQGQFTAWTDPDMTSARKFYIVEIK